MKFLRDLKAASEFLFFAEGMLILAALLFWRNEVWTYEAELFLRYADLPFALNAIVLAASTLRLSFIPHDQAADDISENPILDAVIVTGALLVFGLLLFVDLGIPDRI